MNSVYVPNRIVGILKKVANVVGVLGISNHCLLHPQAKPNEQRTEDAISGTRRELAWHTLKAVEWPSWPTRSDWQRARNVIMDKWVTMSRDTRAGVTEGLLRAHTSPLPWLGRTIAWPSVLSMQVNLNPNDFQDGPPPPPEKRNDEQRGQDPFKLLPAHQRKLEQLPPDPIHQLLASPTLFNPLQKPRFPIVLCHGLYGFDARGPASLPSMRVHYWSNVLKILRERVGAEVIVTSVPGTGSIASRAARLDEQLKSKAKGQCVNMLAHSMGGLDSRYLITHLRPTEYTPLSLMSVSTPHRGSPFMDWCAERIGIGKRIQQERELAENGFPLVPPVSPNDVKTEAKSSLSFSSLPSSFTTLLLSIVDSPAYSNLTSAFLNNVFNPATPDDPNVKYFSVAGRLSNMSIWHPLWLPKAILDETERGERLKLKKIWEERQSLDEMDSDDVDGVPLWAQEKEWGNDGLVTVQSAKWGEFLGIMEGCEHWEMRGARGIDIDLPSLNSLNFGLSKSGSDEWSIMDWSRFLHAWKREENLEKDAKRAAAAASSSLKTGSSSSSADTRAATSQDVSNANQDAVVKASTEQLSTVFDWLVDQLPTSVKPVSLNMPLKAPESVIEAANEFMKKARSKTQKQDAEAAKTKVNDNSKKNELGTKEDLEKFYVTLSRKMYDEGF
ncbi:hypothetical protein AGABI2DRAFT_186349 [Agaricus bisporus var. bisporus H97]|uniref:hypothetical protein n=1 Tax=Agaricus bisporus var. bisporus (strain H97 / ATCC MYA-4626 / FGSC 10389) TaxID=936046 RepID=UPI00029F7CB0|nr:hypothetical protein AGABI2DRAFT_186349 [Agaricus bisporus var. bisporus H97]EKV45617.1 hypothetical protein AGABI2DRAFT_186349 [Agaricus bisporus var. bisporus H97]